MFMDLDPEHPELMAQCLEFFLHKNCLINHIQWLGMETNQEILHMLVM